MLSTGLSSRHLLPIPLSRLLSITINTYTNPPAINDRQPPFRG